jgi:hypothetical protein
MKNLLLKEKTDLLKCIIVGIIGFGLFGILWGGGLFYETFTTAAEPMFHLPDTKIYDPFSYLPVILFLALGGSFLAILFKNKKKIFKRLVLFGLLGSIVGIIGGAFVSYPFFLWGSGMIRDLPWILNYSQQTWEAVFIIEPSLAIGESFLIFAFIGFIVGAFYALALKIKILSLAKYGAIGFALGSLIGPVIGNGILNLFSSLFLTYLITFFIICAFFGMFLGLGIYRNAGNSNLKSLKIQDK